MTATEIAQSGSKYSVTYWETIVFERTADDKIILRTQIGVKKVSATTKRRINQAFTALDLPYTTFNQKGEFYVMNTNTGELQKDERDEYLTNNMLMTVKI